MGALLFTLHITKITQSKRNARKKKLYFSSCHEMHIRMHTYQRNKIRVLYAVYCFNQFLCQILVYTRQNKRKRKENAGSRESVCTFSKARKYILIDDNESNDERE